MAALADVGAGTASPPPDPTPTEVVVGGTPRHNSSRNTPGHTGGKRSNERCRGCGDRSCGGSDRCHARNATCRNCGRKGHFWRLCSSLKPGGKPPTTNAVVIGSVETAACLSVQVTCPQPRSECTVMAVAETGAQVCTAGRPLLRSLGVSPRHPQASPRIVSHVAGGGVRLLGSLTCSVTAGTITTTELVYIAKGCSDCTCHSGPARH